jgi:tetratricopeptide (TPR) repeat protein
VEAFQEQFEKAKALRMKGHFPEAISLLNRLETMLKPDQRIERTKCLNELSQCLWRKGQPVEAAQQAQSALSLAEQYPIDLVGQATALNNLGVVSWRCGELANAMEYFRRSLAIRKELGDRQAVADALNNLGIIFWRLGDLKQAEEHYRWSFDIRQEIGDPREIAMSLTNLGIVYWQRGELAKAEKFLQRSLALKKTIGDPQTIAESRYQLVQTFLLQNALEAASTEVEELSQLHEANQLPDITVKYCLANGRLKQKTRNFASALNQFERAKRLAEEIPDFDLQIDAIRFLIQALLLLYQFGEQEMHLNLSKALLEELKQLSKDKELQGTYVETLFIWGLLSHATFDLKDAMERFQQAEEQATELGIHEIAQRARTELDKLQKQLEKVIQLQKTSPHAYERVKLQEVMEYLETIRGWVTS